MQSAGVSTALYDGRSGQSPSGTYTRATYEEAVPVSDFMKGQSAAAAAKSDHDHDLLTSQETPLPQSVQESTTNEPAAESEEERTLDTTDAVKSECEPS